MISLSGKSLGAGELSRVPRPAFPQRHGGADGRGRGRGGGVPGDGQNGLGALARSEGKSSRARGENLFEILFPYRKKHNTIYIQNEIHYSFTSNMKEDKFLGHYMERLLGLILHKKKHEKHEVHVKTQRWRNVIL